jgi:hypothetical protein
MTIEFGSGATSGVLRLPALGGGWTPVHMTINRVELDKDSHAGLLALRIPTEEEVAAADLDYIEDGASSVEPGKSAKGEAPKRKAKPRKARAPKS